MPTIKMSIHESINYATKNKLGTDKMSILQESAAKYDSRPSNSVRPDVGDLTDREIAQIQKSVDEFYFDLVVVGSALYGKRLGLGSTKSVGHSCNSKSDIDYIVPNKNLEFLFQIGLGSYNDSPQAQWPDFDRLQGIMFTTPSVFLHRLWFKPKAPPKLLQPGMPNLGFAIPPMV